MNQLSDVSLKNTENQGLQSNHGTVVNVKYILSDIYTDDFVEPNALDTDYSIKYQAIADFLFKHDHLTRSIFIKHNSTKCPRCIQNINESNEQQVFIKKSCWFYCLKLFYLLNLTEPKLNYELAVKLIFGYDLNLIDQIRQLSGTFSVREIFIEPPKMSLNDPKVKTLEKPIKLTCISKRVNNKIYQTYLDIIKNPPKLGHNVSYNIPITGYIKLPDYRFKGQEKQQLDFLDYAEKIDIKMWLLKSSIEYLLKSSCQYIPASSSTSRVEVASVKCSFQGCPVKFQLKIDFLTGYYRIFTTRISYNNAHNHFVKKENTIIKCNL